MKVRTSVRRRTGTIQADWHELQSGERVYILKNSQVISAGQVEEVSDSGRVLWISNSSSRTEFYTMSEGISVQRK